MQNEYNLYLLFYNQSHIYHKVLRFYKEICQTLDIYLYEMFCFPYEFHHQNIISNDYLLHPQLEMIHNILDINNTYIYMTLLK